MRQGGPLRSSQNGANALSLSPIKPRTNLGLADRHARPSAVLAPAEVTKFPRKEPKAHNPGQSRGLAGALLSAVKLWERQGKEGATLDETVKETAERVGQVSQDDRIQQGVPAFVFTR